LKAEPQTLAHYLTAIFTAKFTDLFLGELQCPMVDPEIAFRLYAGGGSSAFFHNCASTLWILSGGRFEKAQPFQWQKNLIVRQKNDKAFRATLLRRESNIQIGSQGATLYGTHKTDSSSRPPASRPGAA
jgi:hypothetical protein